MTQYPQYPLSAQSPMPASGGTPWPPTGSTPSGGPPHQRRTTMFALIIILSVLLIAGGLGAAYWFLFRDHSDPMGIELVDMATENPTDNFVSFSERWSGGWANEYGHIQNDTRDQWVVGFTEGGREVELYQFTMSEHSFVISGNSVYVMECESSRGRATITAIDYTNRDRVYTSTLRATLPRCPSDYTVMDDRLFYLEELFTNELIELNLSTQEQHSHYFDFSLAQLKPGYTAAINNLSASDHTIIHALNDSVVRSFNPDTGETAVICVNCFPQTVLGDRVVYSVYPPEDSRAGKVFYEYEISSRVTTLIGAEAYNAGGALSECIVAPVQQGYAYLSTRLTHDADYLATDVFYLPRLSESPQLLGTFPYGMDAQIIPVSNGELLYSGLTGDMMQGDTQYVLESVTLTGELVDSSQGQTGYLNTRFPRYRS